MAKDSMEILKDRDAEIAKIRGYADLTEEAKNRRIAGVNERAQAEYAEAREANDQKVAERLERSMKVVFRIPVSATATEAEEAQIHAAYRSAYKDVYFSTTDFESLGQAEGELEGLLGLAERTGDKLLARAVYHRAIDLGVQGVVDFYLAARPQEDRAWEAHTTAYQEAAQSRDVPNLIGRGITERTLYSVEQSSGFGA
jgi:hypothetical protein